MTARDRQDMRKRAYAIPTLRIVPGRRGARRRAALPWLVAGAAACFASAITGSAVQAHDPEPRIVPEERVELSFGRTEEYDYEAPEPGSYRLPSLGDAADGALLDGDGEQRSLHEVMRGRITVLAFIYTRCADPQGCPLSMGLLHDLDYVGEKDPAVGDALRLITVSFDPEHDTPEVMADYAAALSGDDRDGTRWLFLTARTNEDLKPVLAAYDQPIGKRGDGSFTHQLRVYLIDRELRVRNIYSLGFMDPRLVIADVRTLLLEERKGRRGM